MQTITSVLLILAFFLILFDRVIPFFSRYYEKRKFEEIKSASNRQEIANRRLKVRAKINKLKKYLSIFTIVIASILLAITFFINVHKEAIVSNTINTNGSDIQIIKEEIESLKKRVDDLEEVLKAKGEEITNLNNEIDSISTMLKSK